MTQAMSGDLFSSTNSLVVELRLGDLWEEPIKIKLDREEVLKTSLQTRRLICSWIKTPKEYIEPIPTTSMSYAHLQWMKEIANFFYDNVKFLPAGESKIYKDVSGREWAIAHGTISFECNNATIADFTSDASSDRRGSTEIGDQLKGGVTGVQRKLIAQAMNISSDIYMNNPVVVDPISRKRLVDLIEGKIKDEDTKKNLLSMANDVSFAGYEKLLQRINLTIKAGK